MSAAAFVLFLFASGLSTQDLSSDRWEAQRLLDQASPCSIEGLGPARELIRRFEGRREPELKLIVARARLQAGSVFWFRQRARDARNFFADVIRLYENEEAIEFERIVARARYMMARSGGHPRNRQRWLEQVISRYAGADDIELLQTYGNALYSLSDLMRDSGNQERAEELRRQAAETYRTRIIPRLPAVDEDAQVCV